MASRPHPKPVYPEWHHYYNSALLEPRLSERPELIEAAEGAIHLHLQDLSEGNSSEQEAANYALRFLQLLRQNVEI